MHYFHIIYIKMCMGRCKLLQSYTMPTRARVGGVTNASRMAPDDKQTRPSRNKIAVFHLSTYSTAYPSANPIRAEIRFQTQG